MPLSRILKVQLDRPSRLEIDIEDSRGDRTIFVDTADKRHEVGLHGFRPRDRVTLRVRAIDDVGSSTSEPVHFRVADLPRRFPVIDVLADDPAQTEPGIRLLPVELVSDEESVAWLVALDSSHEVVWLWDAFTEVGAARLHPSGSIHFLANGVLWELDLLGDVTGQWGSERQQPARRAVYQHVDLEDLHHAVYPQPGAGRFLALSKGAVHVDDYPCSYLAPSTGCGPATLEDTRLVHFERDGQVLRDFGMATRIDPFRISYGSLEKSAKGQMDWAHGNALLPIPWGGYLVGLRHQDALVALDRNGDLRWIFGDPQGWSAEMEPYLLQPVGESFEWPYHAHGPHFGADGTLWLFDNGNNGEVPGNRGLREPEISRVAGYRIDEEEGTVEQVADFVDTATGPMFSRALGSAAELPVTGNLLGHYGMPTSQGAMTHRELGWGSRAVRLVEWTPEGELVSDIRLRSDEEVEQKGWRSYATHAVPSLYPDGVEVFDQRTP